MGTFVLGVVVGVVINLVTALFSRHKALQLLPWLLFYIFLHAAYVTFGEATYVAAGLVALIVWKLIIYQVDKLALFTATRDDPLIAVSTDIDKDGSQKNIEDLSGTVDLSSQFSVELAGAPVFKVRETHRRALYNLQYNLPPYYYTLVLVVDINVASSLERKVEIALDLGDGRGEIHDTPPLIKVATGKFPVSFDIGPVVDPGPYHATLIIVLSEGERKKVFFSLAVPEVYRRS
jgi:hypothetical protein